MEKIKSYKALIVFLLFIAASTFSFYTLLLTPYSLSYAEQQKIVARVNGAPITEEELEGAIDTYIPPGAFHGNIGGQKREEYIKPALEQLIEKELLFQEAKVRGMAVNDRDIDKIVKDAEKRFEDKKGFDRALKASGLTLNEYREILKKDELIKKILKVEIEEKSRYSDKELEEYYNTNKSKFFRPEGFRIRHIFLKISPTALEKEKKEIKEKAKGLVKKAKAGEDFSGLAYKYSEEPYRVKGGDLGWVHKGRLEPAIEEAALKLKIGEVSGLIETISGYHIVKLEDKRPAEQLNFSDVKDSLRKELESKRYKEIKEIFMKKLEGKAKIEIY